MKSLALSYFFFFMILSGASVSVAWAEDENPADLSFSLKQLDGCEQGLIPLTLPNFLLVGQEFKATLLPLRLAIAELLFNHDPENPAKDSVIADAEKRIILENILHDRIDDRIKAQFSEWEYLFQGLLIQSKLLYRHERLNLNQQTLSQILEQEIPHSVKSLLVPSATAPEVKPVQPQSRLARFFGFSKTSESAIKKPAALDNYKYLNAPNLYKVLYRFDERLRPELLKMLITDPMTEFPEITHLEAYIILAAIPRKNQSYAWNLLLPKVITRAEMFPAKYLAQIVLHIEPEAFLKSLAANQGQLRLEELLNLIKESREKHPIRIEEVAKSSSFPTVLHEEAVDLIKRFQPLDFDSAYAIAWSYSTDGRSLEEITEFFRFLESAANPSLDTDQIQKIRAKIAERIWTINQQAANIKQSLFEKIKIARYLDVGRTFLLSRLYWELQTVSHLNEEELIAIFDALPTEAHRSTFDGSLKPNGKTLSHEVIYADNLFSEMTLELRLSSIPAVKWYYSDLYWMGITTNLVVANMALLRAPQQSLKAESMQKIKQKLDQLFMAVKPLTPAIIDPDNKWKLPWRDGNNKNVYSFNPSQPNELVPGRRGVTLERVQAYFNRILNKLGSR